MKKLQHFLQARLTWILFFAAVSSVIYLIGCRDKAGPSGPDPNPNPTDGWTLVLRHAVNLRHHYNDTITVRIFDSQGVVRGGIEVRSICTAGPNNITSPVFTASDTIARPWGTTFPMIYVGTVDTLDMDIIQSWAIRNDSDTVAYTSTSFKIIDPPSPY